MYRYVVITGPETAAGFSLTGVDVVVPESDDTASGILRRLVAEPEVGLVALNERYLEFLDEPLRSHIERSALPVVVVFPDLRREGPESAEAYLAALIERAIGYRIRLRT